jgi:hypothetical protein
VQHARGGRPPVGAAALTGHEEAHLDRGVRLAERQLERLARLLDDELRRRLPAVAEQQRELTRDVPPLDGRALGPVGLGHAGGGDGTLDVGSARACDAT